MLLTAEQLKSPPSLVTEDVHMPEFGGDVRVKQWSGAEYDVWANFVSAQNNDSRLFRASVIAATVVDEVGNLVLDMNGSLSLITDKWPAPAVTRVYEVAARLNAIGNKALEDAEKN